MYTEKTYHTSYAKDMTHLRIHDLIAKTAHVSYKNTLRVLIALRAVSAELDCAVDSIANAPYSGRKPTPDQARACNEAYLRMHETGCMRKYLFEVEQVI